MKRILSLLLAALMLLSFAACAAPEGPIDDTSATDAATEEDTIDIKPDIEKKNYSETFRMIGLTEPGIWYYAEEVMSDNTMGSALLNDAIYEMNSQVEAHLGIEVEYEQITTVVTGGEIFDTVSPTIMSGDDVYQLCILHPYYSYNSFISRGYAMDFYDLEALDLDKPYWNREVMEQLSINDHAYIALGDFCSYTLNILYCNKNLLANAGREVPYELVRNKTWTLDEFTSLTAGLYEDANGNGQEDNGDIYGYAALWDANGSAYMQASDIYVVTRDEDTDTFELSLYGERLMNMYEKLYKWSENDSTYLWNYGNSNNQDIILDFHAGRSYITMTALGTEYLDAEFDVGILPLPKYDVAQEDYAHVNWGNNLVMPTTVQNKAMAGEALELLSYYSRTIVQQTYYDEVLQLRASDAPDDREMVELIYATVVYDPGIAYCDGYLQLWNLVYLPTFAILDGQASIETYYRKNERGANNALKKLVKSKD